MYINLKILKSIMNEIKGRLSQEKTFSFSVKDNWLLTHKQCWINIWSKL